MAQHFIKLHLILSPVATTMPNLISFTTGEDDLIDEKLKA